MAHRRVGTALLAFFVSIAAVIAVPPAASALGSGSLSCGGSSFTGSSYRTTFTNAGGQTQRPSSCSAVSVSVRLHYEAYSGGPTYWTPNYAGSYFVSRQQSGTFGGQHCRHLSGGGLSPCFNT